MSAVAQKLTATQPVPGSVAIRLPEAERSARRARKAATGQGTRRLIVVAAAGWLMVMGMAFALVYLNTQVLAEARAITAIRADLQTLELQNQELEGKLVRAASVTEVERWAVAHGMKRPTNVKALRGTAGAVAVKPAPAAEPLAAPGDSVAAGFWDSLRSYVSRISDAVSLTGKPR